MAKPGLTKRQRKLLGPYLRELADGLNLRDWTINIVHEPIPGDAPAAASCAGVHGRHWADIRFGAWFADFDPEVQREICIHELLHCHVKAWSGNDDHELSALIGRPAYTIYAAAKATEFEHAVDAIANAIARHFPLPPLLTKAK